MYTYVNIYILFGVQNSITSISRDAYGAVFFYAQK